MLEDALFTRSPLAIALADAAGRIVRVNDAWRGAFGGTDAGWRGRPLASLGRPDESAAIASAASVADAAPLEIEVLDADGARRPMRLHVVADGSGGMVATAVDGPARAPADPLHEMAERLPAVLYRWYRRPNGDSGHYYMSGHAREIFGIDPADIVETPTVLPLHPDDVDRWASSIEESIAAMSDWHFEGRFQHPDGTMRWCRASARPFRVGDEIVFDGVLVDVNDAHEDAQRLREICDSMPGVVYQFEILDDGSWRFPVLSEGMKRIFGIDNRLDKDTVNRIIAGTHPDDVEWVSASIAEAAANMTPWHAEYRVLVPDGVRWVRAQSVPQPRPDGRVHWNGCIVAIDDLKAVEADLREKERTLIERDWMLRQGAALARIGPWVWDEVANEPIYLSESIAVMHGVAPGELPRLYVDMSGLAPTFHPDDRPHVLAALRGLREGRPYDVEARIVRADGSILHVREIAEPVFGPDGKVVRSHGVMQDITAMKQREIEATEVREHLEAQARSLSRLARELDQARLRAEESSRAKSQFLANMSHELRTPLNAILGFSEIMGSELFGPIGNERYTAYAGHIVESGRHLLALLDDILDLAKIEAGKLAARPERIELAALVAQCAELIRVQSGTRALVAEVAGGLAVEADATQLRQVLLNLLSNAVKFTPEDGRIEVGACARDGEVEIMVRDTGIGIPEGEIDRLLEPFERGASALEGRYQGAGLGLALVNRLVGLNGGRLAIESMPGAGTIVRVTFPAAESGAAGDRLQAAG
jgi:PAS domain S-box-containing protein